MNGTRAMKQTGWRWTYRYLTGRPLDGYRRTDCGYLRRGSKVLTETGHASRWAMLPGYQRQAWRVGTPAGLALVFIGAHAEPVLTAGTGSVVAVAGGYWTGRRVRRTVRSWKRERKLVRPLVAALEPYAELPAEDIRRRLVLEDEQVKVPMAPHHNGAPEKVATIERIVTQRVGGEWETVPQFRTAPFYVLLKPRPAPPMRVPFEQVRELVEGTTQDRPLLGLGTGAEPLFLDFTGEIAHLAMSIGTGGGKSSALRLLVAQFAYHGVRDFTVCDVKWVSLAGMEDVPGLRVYRHITEIWEAVARERAEMDRRYQILLKNPSKVFPRRILVMEEQNAFALETAVHWREIKSRKDPALAPVWTDIALLLVKARQVNMNIISVYQRMSADACGGGTFRDQYGLKVLSRFSPQAWDTLVGTRPRGVSSAIQGRGIAVMGGLQRAVQLPYISPEDALALACSGPAVTVTDEPSHEVKAPVTRDVTESAVASFTLAEAARQPWCHPTYDTLRQRVHRAVQAGRMARAERYTREDLASVLDGTEGDS